MPIYLAHGFRWPREGSTGIRVHTIIHNLDNVSSDYIQNDHSRDCLLEFLRELYPDTMEELEKPGTGRAIDFLEQYDPDDTSPESAIQPWAFVCDKVVMIAGGDNAEYYASKLLHKGGFQRNEEEKGRKKERKKTLPLTKAKPFTAPASITALSVSMEDVRAEGAGTAPEAALAFQDLRDQIAEGEIIGWWVVYNGDPDRVFDDDDEDDEEEAEEEKKDGRGDESAVMTPPARSSARPTLPKSPTTGRMPPPVPPASWGPPERSSTQSTLTTSTANTTPSTKERRSSDRTGEAPDTARPRSMSKGQGLKKFFRKKS